MHLTGRKIQDASCKVQDAICELQRAREHEARAKCAKKLIKYFFAREVRGKERGGHHVKSCFTGICILHPATPGGGLGAAEHPPNLVKIYLALQGCSHRGEN